MPDRLVLHKRADFFSRVRQFFTRQQCLEIQVPIRQQGANIDHGVTPVACGDGHYLITSPEHYLKRMLCAGSGDCFAISPCFRKDEYGRQHLPEFTMLEWYRCDWDHLQLADECVTLINTLCVKQAEAHHITYRNAFLASINCDPFTAATDELLQHCSSSTLTVRSEILDLLMLEHIEPSFDPQQITILTDYPANQAAQARHDTDDHGKPIARRFEIYYNGMELANGYHECPDASEIRTRMQADNSNNYPLDETYLTALEEQGLPDCAGVALGLDRLFMIHAGIEDIREITI